MPSPHALSDASAVLADRLPGWQLADISYLDSGDYDLRDAVYARRPNGRYASLDEIASSLITTEDREVLLQYAQHLLGQVERAVESAVDHADSALVQRALQAQREVTAQLLDMAGNFLRR